MVRRRSSVLTIREQTSLAELVKEFPKVLDKNVDLITVELRTAAWEKIAREFNAEFPKPVPKKWTQLRRSWTYLRNKVRQDYSDYIRRKTYFPSCRKHLDPVIPIVASILQLDRQNKSLNKTTSITSVDSCDESEEETQSQSGDATLECPTTNSLDDFTVKSELEIQEGIASSPLPVIKLDDSSFEFIYAPAVPELPDVEYAELESGGYIEQSINKEVGSRQETTDTQILSVADLEPSNSTTKTASIVSESRMMSQKRSRGSTALDLQLEKLMDVRAKRLLLKSLKLDIEAKVLQSKILAVDFKNKDLDCAVKKFKLENEQLESKRLESQMKCIPLIESACEKFAQMAKNVGDAGFVAQKAAFSSLGKNK